MRSATVGNIQVLRDRKRYILCYNPKEAQRQRRHRDTLVGFLEAELERHPKPSSTAQWAIDLLASRRFKRYLRIIRSKLIRIDRGAIREASKYDGKWVIENKTTPSTWKMLHLTTRVSWSSSDAFAR